MAVNDKSNEEREKLMEDLLASNSRLHRELNEKNKERDLFLNDLATATSKVTALEAKIEILKGESEAKGGVEAESVKVKFHILLILIHRYYHLIHLTNF